MHKVQIALDGVLAGVLASNGILNALNGNNFAVYCLCAVGVMQCIKSIMQIQTIRREREYNDWALRTILKMMGIKAKEPEEK
jgi:hypothetical protein